MPIKPPEPIRLTEEERRLYDEIVWDLEALYGGPDEAFEACMEKVGELAGSLVGRDAIPAVREAYFTDPEMNVGGRGKSRKDVLVGGGTYGEAMFRHPRFMKHLAYFIHGPSLPAAVVDGLVRVVQEGRDASGGVLGRRVRAYARWAVRDHGLDPGDAAGQFFALAHEIDRPDLARPAYDGARGC